MTMRFTLDVEETLPGFSVANIPPDPTPVVILNENTPQGLPDRIIKDGQSWSLTTKFRVVGITADAIGPGTWTLSAHLLNLDGGIDQTISTTQPYALTIGADDYIIVLNVPAGAVPVGLYKLYISVDLDTAAAVPVTMSAEGPMMKFYKPS